MADTVELIIGGKRIKSFQRYRVDADLYQAADEWEMTLSQPESSVSAGMRVELHVNGMVELTGIVDDCTRTYEKGSGLVMTLKGRDLMGLLVDSHCEQFITVEGMTIKALAEKLLKTVPFINLKQIVYQENVIGKLKGKRPTVTVPLAGFLDTPQKISHIEPGMTVYDVLSTYAASRGLLFYSLPDGTLVFGRPLIGGTPMFDISCRPSVEIVNVIRAEESNDYSRRYSSVKVVTQMMEPGGLGGETVRTSKSAQVNDPTFPFHKPFVQRSTNNSQTPNLRAKMIMESQRRDAMKLSYTVQGHSQRGINWRINEMCQVKDEKLGIDTAYLVYGRTFERSKEQGTTTTVRLGPAGLVGEPTAKGLR